MEINLAERRCIDILVDQDKNIVLFPYGKSTEPIDYPPGVDKENAPKFFFSAAEYPIELNFPFSEQLLADNIEFAFEEWGKHKCYPESKKFEVEYYGIKGFKNAMKGKRYITVSYDVYSGIRVRLYLPRKAGYSYYELANTKLPEDANWIDFAKAVLHYINIDVSTLDTFRTFKRELNI